MGRKGGFPGGGMGNMGAMMKQAQKMQVELARAQEEIKDMTFEALSLIHILQPAVAATS